MPDVRNCKRCGKIFNYIGGAVTCPVCREEDEKDFQRVKEYLYRYPGAALSEVATTLELSVDKIKKFLREDRLEIINTEGNVFLDCERCGKAIKSGRYCADCEREVTGNLRTVSSEISRRLPARDNENIKKSTEGRMKYLRANEESRNKME